MKNFKCILFVIIYLLPGWLGAKQVSPENARRAVETLVQSRNLLRDDRELNLVQVKTTANKMGNTTTRSTTDTTDDVLYYVFNVGESGFVVVSGDDRAVPILGYSDAGVYDPDRLPPNFVYYLDGFLAEEIEQAIAQEIPQSEKAKELWETYLNGNISALRAASINDPLLGADNNPNSIAWDQNKPFNVKCPLYKGEYTATGCMATAMAMVMKYYNYPQKGKGTIGNYTTGDLGISIPSVDISNHTYNWSKMFARYTYNTYSGNPEEDEVADLMYHCGISMKMDYNTLSVGSAAAMAYAATAFRDNFSYGNSINHLQRNYYSTGEWEALIKSEIDNSRPVIYGGQDPVNGGHAFVCDGYDGNGRFHFNWGWSGLANGYYTTDAVNPTGTNYKFNQDQELILSIVPAAGGNASQEIKLRSKTNMSASKTTLAAGEGFTVFAPVSNLGLNNFSGSIGIAIVDASDNILSVIGQVPLNLNQGYTIDLTINCTIPASTPSGNCRVRVVYKTTNAPGWAIVTGMIGYIDVLNLTVNNTQPPVSTNLTWRGTASSNWNELGNWEGGKVPTSGDTVTISGKAPNFPVLTNPVSVSAIRFEPGAQIGNQHYLTGKAFVQYDLGKRERWNMLSIPLKQVYPSDFTFGGYPQTWVRAFTASSGGSVTQGSWVTLSQNTNPFSFGDGLLLWLNADNHAGEPQNSNMGLKLLNNIRELPFFQHHADGSPDRDLYKKVHQAHDYSSATGKSTFFNVENQSGQYVRGTISYSVNRDQNAYQLAGESVTKTVEFADGYFALTGNPYMAALDFSKMYNQNKAVINDTYHVWTDAGFESYSCSMGAFGVIGVVEQSAFIAPLQGFLVEKSVTASSASVAFNENMTTVQSNIKLRAATANENRLTIDARNSIAGVRTIIAKMDGGQDKFGNLDSRKIINTIGSTPEIYTLKPYNSGLIAVGINVINNDNLLIPIGLATNFTGQIKLSFSGMNTYHAKLTFTDAAANKEIDLTGLASFDYVFNYTPKTVNGEAAVCEDRFFIRISKSATGIEEIPVEKVNIFEANGYIQAVSCAANPIKEVAIYNLQGVIIYKESFLNAISLTVNRKLPLGAYIVKVITEKNLNTVKLIIN